MSFDLAIFWQQLISTAYLRGAMISILVSVISMTIGIVIGFVVALGRGAKRKSLNRLAAVYIWLFRSIPVLLLLLITWNALPQILPVLRATWYNPFVAACIALSVAVGAYMAEIVRSAFMGVDDGQILAARALGLSPVRVMQKIILPQATRIAIPPTGNQFIALIKYSSLASVISLHELLTTAQIGVSITFRYAEYYAAAIVYYLILVSLATLAQGWLERKYIWSSTARSKERIIRRIFARGESYA